MNQETEGPPRVEVVNDAEYPGASLLGKTGVIIGTIPPQSKEPHRFMVRVDLDTNPKGPKVLINFRHGDVRTVEEEKLPNTSM